MTDNGWISVNERVPEKEINLQSDVVLGWDENAGPFVGYYDYGNESYYQNGWHDIVGYPISAVTHWQPLPAPLEATT